MTPKLFKQINEFLARLIYAADTSAAMSTAAKAARKDLHRLFGADRKPKSKALQNVQTLTN